MTKQDELTILDRAIADLGADSYCGGWLADVRAEIESNLRADMSPLATIADTIRHCEELVAIARARAYGIGKQADEYACKTMGDARKSAETIRGRMAQMLREQLRTLDA